MQRVSGANYDANAFGAGKNGYQDYNPSNGRAGTTPNASALNALQEEVASFIEAQGLALDPNDNTQLAQALSLYVTARIEGLDDDTTVANLIAQALTGYAHIASPAFTGTPTAPTPAAGDSSTKIATTAFVGNAGIGTAAQAWQDVTGSRVPGTTYYNTTSRPIMVSVSLPDTNNFTAFASVVVNGVTLVNGAQYDGGTSVGALVISFIVPPSGSYSVSLAGTGGAIGTWCELR